MSYFDFLGSIFLITDTYLTSESKTPLRIWWSYSPFSQKKQNLHTNFKVLGLPTKAYLGLHMCKGTTDQELLDKGISRAPSSTNMLQLCKPKSRW